MQKSSIQAAAVKVKDPMRLTPDETRQVIESRPDMRAPKAVIDAAAWAQVDQILKQRKLHPPK